MTAQRGKLTKVDGTGTPDEVDVAVEGSLYYWKMQTPGTFDGKIFTADNDPILLIKRNKDNAITGTYAKWSERGSVAENKWVPWSQRNNIGLII